MVPAAMNFQPARAEMIHLHEEMFPKYKEYCLTVSERGMAVSIETMVYMRWLCEALDAKRVADLGSGYSSFVLRQYQATHPGVEVVSVDDSPEWLDKTAEWLKANDLPTDGLIGPDEWRAGLGSFDVILHDYAGGTDREDFMPAAAARLAPDGFLIFDDAHHLPHRIFMAATARDHGLALFDLFEQTLDLGMRHAVVAHRIPA
jgi:predicted O-methyltransferase YrrM